MSENLTYICKDILDTDCEYILQQNNCVTNKGKGLSLAIKEHFGVCPYDGRENRDVPGSIQIIQSKQKNIICLFGQVYPGKPRYANDTKEKRLTYFREGLNALKVALEPLKDSEPTHKIAVPYRIGCGLAGGDWNDYENILKKYSCHFNFVIHRL
jgi:O-acetyl-ADP-ribose deacetylase (regulator of RNase III)